MRRKGASAKIIALLLIVSLIGATVAGCGKKKPETDGSVTEQENTEEASESVTPAPEGMPDPEAADPSVASSFDDDKYTYRLDKVLARSPGYGGATYNDDCFVVGRTSYDYDYEFADEESYPDRILTLDVTYYDYDGREIGGFVEHNDSSDSYYDFNLDSKGNVYFIHAIQNYNDTQGYFTAYELLGYDRKGEIIDSVIFEDSDDDFRIKDIIIDENDRLIAISNEGIMTFKNREIADRIDYDDAEDFCTCYPLKDGDILVTTYGVEDMEMSVINIDSRRRKDLGKPPFSLSSLFATCPGKDSDLILSGDGGIYTYNTGDTQYAKVASFPMIGSSVYNLDNVRLLDNGDILGGFYDYDEDEYRIARFTPYDASVDDRQILTVGCLGVSSDQLDMISEFNEKDPHHRLILHNYTTMDMLYDYEGGFKAYIDDISSGNGPDIMLLSTEMPVRIFMTKGVFADLKPLIEADPDVDINDYAPNVIDALTYNGELTMFSTDFVVNTAVCKSAYMNGKMGNRLSDFLYTSDWTGAKVYSDDNTKDNVFYYTMRSTIDDYIDWDDLTCDFESAEFLKVLSYANTYPSEYNYTYDDSHEGPYSAFALPYRSGEILCEITSFYDANSYVETKQGVFGTDISLAGFPTTGEVGSSITCSYPVAISANCADKEGAWEFVKMFFDKNISDKIYTNLPTSKAGLEKAVGEAGGKYKKYDEYGNFTWEYPSYLVGSEYVQISPMSKKECSAFINDIYKINRMSLDDSEINKILTEESNGYFMGAYDAATAAKSIQERVSKYLSSFDR